MSLNNVLNTVDDEDDEKTEIQHIVVGKTLAGKEMAAFQDPQGYLKIKFVQGGQLPRKLRGRYTDYQNAENAIKAYLAEERMEAQIALDAQREQELENERKAEAVEALRKQQEEQAQTEEDLERSPVEALQDEQATLADDTEVDDAEEDSVEE